MREGQTQIGEWWNVSGYNSGKGSWARAWWTDSGNKQNAFILRYWGYNTEYYVTVVDGSPIQMGNENDTGPFKTLKAAKVFYILAFGGSL